MPGLLETLFSTYCSVLASCLVNLADVATNLFSVSQSLLSEVYLSRFIFQSFFKFFNKEIFSMWQWFVLIALNFPLDLFWLHFALCPKQLRTYILNTCFCECWIILVLLDCTLKTFLKILNNFRWKNVMSFL